MIEPVVSITVLCNETRLIGCHLVEKIKSFPEGYYYYPVFIL